MFYDLVVGIVAGILTTILALIAKHQWSWIQSWFDAEIRRQAQLIDGRWDVVEEFPASKTKGAYTLDLHPTGRRVTGELTCVDGPDKGGDFDVEGTFKDLILTLTWKRRGPHALESGTMAANLGRDGRLVGHGVYVEPGDGKVYPSNFTAMRQP